MTIVPSPIAPSAQQEHHRLKKEADFIGPCTRKFLENAGLMPGMKVLELGSGGGDLSLLLADLVGRKGMVVGFEVDESLIDAARDRVYLADYNNVFFMHEDIRASDLNEHFDAVVGRSCLASADDPAAIVQKAISYLPPGGIVALQEADFTLIQGNALTHPACPLYSRVLSWVCEARELAGTRTHMGFELRRTFLTAGLPEPQMHIDTPVGGGPDWAGYEYLAQTVRSLLPTIQDYGIATVDEIAIHTLAERLKNEVTHYNAVAASTTFVGACSRKTWTNQVGPK